jgi:hypothetical protein
MKVFLGGTCNESTWRDRLTRQLKIDYFNPVVDDWTEECMAEEIRQREKCDFVLYVITPFMTGTYAIAEVVDDSNKRPEKTLFCFLECDVDITGASETFTDGQIRSLKQVRKMVEGNGATVFNGLNQLGVFLNEQAGVVA